jgi:hypothetical protein
LAPQGDADDRSLRLVLAAKAITGTTKGPSP